MIATAASDTCPFKAQNVPACQIYPDAGTTNPPPIFDAATDATIVTDAGDSGSEIDDGGAEAEAAAPIDSKTYSLTSSVYRPVAMTADAQHLYVVATNISTGAALATLDPMFVDGALDATNIATDNYYEPLVAAASGHLLVSGSEDSYFIDIVDGGPTSNGVIGNATALSTLVAFPSTTGATFVYRDPSQADFNWVTTNDGGAHEDRVSLTALAIDPTTLTAANPKFATGIPAETGDLDAGQIVYAPLVLTNIAAGLNGVAPVANLTSYASELAFADPMHIVWTDKDARVCFTGVTASDAGGICFATDAGTLQGTLAGGSSAAFWIGSDAFIHMARFTGPAGASPAVTKPSLPGGASLLYIDGNQLYWADATNVYRRDVRSLL